MQPRKSTTKLMAAIAVLLLAPATSKASVVQCYGGTVEPGTTFMEAEISDFEGRLCTRICLTEEHWNSEYGAQTLANFVYAAGDGADEMPDVQRELQRSLRFRRHSDIGVVTVHAFTSRWIEGRKISHRTLPLLCS